MNASQITEDTTATSQMQSVRWGYRISKT
jgi:hypothetical protein